MKIEKSGKNFDKKIVEAIQQDFIIFGWNSFDGAITKCELKIKAYRKDYNEIELLVRKGSAQSLVDLINGEKKINIYIPELSLSFVANIKSLSENSSLKLDIPEEYSFFERRRYERVQPTRSVFTQLNLNRLQTRIAVHDISVGGLSIILPKSNKVYLNKNDVFENVNLYINERKLSATIECVSAQLLDRFKSEALPYGGYKIAFRFIHLSESDKEFLIEYVTHEVLLASKLKKAN